MTEKTPGASAEVSMGAAKLLAERLVTSVFTDARTFDIGDANYRIEPTSCRCGGSYAWLKERPSGAWEMVGCICHHLPTGEQVQAHQPDPDGSGFCAVCHRALLTGWAKDPCAGPPRMTGF